MKDRLIHYIRKKSEEDLRPQYNDLAGTVERLIKKAICNDEIKIAIQIQITKDFFRFIRRRLGKIYIHEDSECGETWQRCTSI